MPPLHLLTLNRRHLALAATATLLPGAVAAQQASPAATPSASPTAVPPTPTPNPVPDHTITIVEGIATYGPPSRGGELRLAIQSTDPADANPVTQTQDMTLLHSVFEGLVAIDPVTMEPRPGLAASWEWSQDNLTLTFTLRNDATWHDGSEFTATDAALTCIVYRDDYDSALAGFYALVDTVEAVNDSTLKITFLAPDGQFVANGASQPMLQAARYQTLWDELPLGEKTISRPDQSIGDWIGTGPWRMASAEEGAFRLERFDDYRDDATRFDALVLTVIDDPAARLEAWKQGDLDVLPVTASLLPQVWQNQGNLFAADAPVSMFAAFNFHNPANVTSTMMVDVSLRTALDLAVDRDKHAREICFGFADQHATGITPQPWLHDDGLRTPKRDLDAARQILADGGWADYDGDGVVEDVYGNKADLFLIVREDERPELLAMVNALQADWAEIGVRLSIQPLSPDVFDDRWVQGREYDLIAYSLVSYPAFNEFDLIGSNWDIRWNTNGWNPGGYYNAGVDQAIQEWFAATDPDAMRAAAIAIQQGIVADPFAIWFGFPQDLVLTAPDLQGFNTNMLHYSIGSHTWWRGEGTPMVPTPTPQATPVSTPQGTPGATPRS